MARGAMRESGRRSRDAPAAGSAPSVGFWRAMADLWSLVVRSRAPQLPLRLTAAMVLTLAGKGLGVLAPLLLGRAVNDLAEGQGATAGLSLMFASLAIGWAAIRLASAAAPNLRDMIFGPVTQAAQTRAATETFAHALSLSLDFHQTKRSGALSRTIERGSRAVDFLLRVLIFNLAPTALELVLAAGVLAGAYDWRFAAVAVVTVAVYGVLTFAISNWRMEHRRTMNAADSEAAGRAVDALINYETVKSFGAETRAVDQYGRALTTYGAAAVTANSSLAVLNIVQAVVMNIGLGVMALLAGLEAAAGRMGPGDVTASILILVSLYQPLNILGFAYREVRQSFIDMEAMTDLLNQAPDVAEPAQPLPLPPADARGGALAFEDVAFRHSARSAGLEGVSFVAEPGQTVALVGPSGAGKSTMVKLALRLVDPQGGRVLLDGVDLRDIAQADVRSAVALVPQDVALFNDTLRANVGFGRPDADEVAIAAALEAAELSAFVAALPDGMETMVGERGLKLSGGERQRVGLARALLADPRLLILDEATSALDSRTEAAIQSALRRAKAGRTTLVVAHRLSTIADADVILVLKAGRIVERGAHADLLAHDGEYAGLWRRQTRAERAERAAAGA